MCVPCDDTKNKCQDKVNKVCDNRKCVQCTSPSHCADGQTCNGKKCIAKQCDEKDNKPCQNNQVCTKDFMCVPCDNIHKCPIGKVCHNGECKDKCSSKMTTPSLCGVGKTCDYTADQCKDFISTAVGTCLNDNIVINNRPPLLISSKVAIFKLAVTPNNGIPTPREARCGLENNEYVDKNALPGATGDETKLARAAVEILDAIFWLSDVDFKQGICETMIRFTISIAQMNDGKIYLAGNLDFSSVNQNPKSTWKTFRLETPGVKLAILYILKKWGFSTDEVSVLKITKGGKKGIHYMRRHAEMQLVRFAKDEDKTITALGVSKPPCCLCDRALTAPAGDYRLADAMEVFSGPGTKKCGVTAKDAPWCGHQYGAKVKEQDPASWTDPKDVQTNEYDLTHITLK